MAVTLTLTTLLSCRGILLSQQNLKFLSPYELQRSALFMRVNNSRLVSDLAAGFDFDRAVKLCSFTGEVKCEAELDDLLWDTVGGLRGIPRLYRQARLLMRLARLGLRPEESGKMKIAFQGLKGSAPLCVLECLLKFFFPILPRVNGRVCVEFFAEIFLQSEAIIELIDSKAEMVSHEM